MKNMYLKIKRKAHNFTNKIRKAILKKLVLGRGYNYRKKGIYFKKLNNTQELFCQWNAERLDISLEESRSRYIHSCNVIPGGHKGIRFEFFMFWSQEIFSVFFGNSEREIFDTYAFHGYRNLLRMLSSEEQKWDTEREHPIIQGLAEFEAITILDFGCGLAHRSRALAQLLMKLGKKVSLVLADIPTIKKSFILWIGKNMGVPTKFLECTYDTPIPDLPPCHVCIVTEVFEHLHNPIKYLHRLNDSLIPKGFLLTQVSDHEPGFLHVTPNLSIVRDELNKLGYKEIIRHVLFRKTNSI